MNALLDHAWFQQFADLAAGHLLDGAVLQFLAFTLVAARLGGLMASAPVFSSPHLPLNLRIFLVIGLALLITPLLPHFASQGFQRLDENRDGTLQSAEVPTQLQPRSEDSPASPESLGDELLTLSEFRGRLNLPKSLLDYLWIALGEFSVGFALGLGTTIVLSGLQLGGQLVDQQIGLGFGEVLNPELGAESSVTGQTLYIFGTAMFLILGGHLLVLSALAETFQILPLGSASVSQPAIDLLIGLVHQSLVLSLQVAAPLLATMSLLTLTIGFLGRTAPQLNLLACGLPIRILLGLFVLALALSGIGEVIADSVPAAIEQLRESLTGLKATPTGN